jgi:Holliday junction resolvase RusA-like endonuclease
MSVEIQFPLEFVVRGTPVSLQSARTKSKEAWKQRVKEASHNALPEGHFATDALISVTLFYFPATDMQGDVDNIVKPILDAFSNHIYIDDRQVERVWVQKFEPGRVFQFAKPSEVLWEALSGEKPLLFVRLGDDLAEGLV